MASADLAVGMSVPSLSPSVGVDVGPTDAAVVGAALEAAVPEVEGVASLFDVQPVSPAMVTETARIVAAAFTVRPRPLPLLRAMRAVWRALGVLSHDVGDTRLMGVVPMPVWMRSVL
ncbi:hypothetical protein E3O59_05835 [Cryobacterium sp. MDB2-33-2]|nr:hypothetical protein E3O59_05835 [Cryobacterium sp. MDB2-33-2]